MTMTNRDDIPAVIAVPPGLAPELEQLVEDTSRRNGEPPDRVRRAVEIAVLKRGIESLRKEVGR